jgi:hypothetical protein
MLLIQLPSFPTKKIKNLLLNIYYTIFYYMVLRGREGCRVGEGGGGEWGWGGSDQSTRRTPMCMTIKFDL